MGNTRILTPQEVRDAKELQKFLELLTNEQKQRVIGFAAALATISPQPQVSSSNSR